jgi:hypothetical protein
MLTPNSAPTFLPESLASTHEFIEEANGRKGRHDTEYVKAAGDLDEGCAKAIKSDVEESKSDAMNMDEPLWKSSLLSKCEAEPDLSFNEFRHSKSLCKSKAEGNCCNNSQGCRLIQPELLHLLQTSSCIISGNHVTCHLRADRDKGKGNCCDRSEERHLQCPHTRRDCPGNHQTIMPASICCSHTLQKGHEHNKDASSETSRHCALWWHHLQNLFYEGSNVHGDKTCNNVAKCNLKLDRDAKDVTSCLVRKAVSKLDMSSRCGKDGGGSLLQSVRKTPEPDNLLMEPSCISQDTPSPLSDISSSGTHSSDMDLICDRQQPPTPSTSSDEGLHSGSEASDVGIRDCAETPCEDFGDAPYLCNISKGDDKASQEDSHVQSCPLQRHLTCSVCPVAAKKICDSSSGCCQPKTHCQMCDSHCVHRPDAPFIVSSTPSSSGLLHLNCRVQCPKSLHDDKTFTLPSPSKILATKVNKFLESTSSCPEAPKQESAKDLRSPSPLQSHGISDLIHMKGKSNCKLCE